MRKFASKQTSRHRTIKQADGSNTEATLILCGYSGSRANIIYFIILSKLLNLTIMKNLRILIWMSKNVTLKKKDVPAVRRSTRPIKKKKFN